jgi:hypothetical protein
MTTKNHVEPVHPPPLSIASYIHGQTEQKTGSDNEPTTIRSSGEEKRFSRMLDNEYFRTCWRIISWTPKRCRWDPESPPKFTLALNLLFAFVSFFFIFYTSNAVTQYYGLESENDVCACLWD